MRILVVHNYYRSAAPSGENQAVNADIAALREIGYEVDTLSSASDDYQRFGAPAASLAAALTYPWNEFSRRGLTSALKRSQYDVVHVHNTFPYLSPAVFHALEPHGQRPAVVMTCHNYRIVCPAAIPMRNHRICVECIDKGSAWPSVVHGCYRNSRLATLPLAAATELHRALGTWRDRVDRFVVLSEFQKHLLSQAGIPSGKLCVRSNFAEEPTIPAKRPSTSNEVLFVGRISEEKGVEVLLRSWAGVPAGLHLTMIGDGPLVAKCKRYVESNHLSDQVSFTGPLSREDTLKRISASAVVVVPSLWFEGFPLVIAEAFALGRPVIASNIGGLPELFDGIGSQTLFPPGDHEALAKSISAVMNDRTLLDRFSDQVASRYRARYSKTASMRRLEEIYREAIAFAKGFHAP
jgi:glycosyltransferase involved in cell wall biosynthesis